MNKQQLANKIWASANKMRSKIEANEYKDYSVRKFCTSLLNLGRSEHFNQFKYMEFIAIHKPLLSIVQL